MKNSAIAAILLLLFSSCIKEDKDIECTPITNMTFTSNSPVNYNDELVLTAPDIANVTSYHWTGPGGFLASDHTVYIPVVNQYDAGEYTLQIEVDGSCESNIASKQITVTIPAAPCTPDPDEFTINGGFFCQANSTTSYMQSDRYIISAYASPFEIKFEFSSDDLLDGIYNIKGYESDLLRNHVVMSIVGGLSGSWHCGDGLLYLKKQTNGSLILTICEMAVSNDAGLNGTLAGKLIHN